MEKVVNDQWWAKVETRRDGGKDAKEKKEGKPVRRGGTERLK